jgi:hypothetical protein
VTDDEYEQRRSRAILAAFQTGRPVFADSDGEMRYADGDREPLADDVGVVMQPIPRATALAVRAHHASRFAFVMSVVAVGANAVMAFWHPWQLAVAGVFGFSAVVWHRVNQHQRAMSQGSDTRRPEEDHVAQEDFGEEETP